MPDQHYSRRAFIRNSGMLAALSGLQSFPVGFASPEVVRRVALIGSGWYGKSDLLRLSQVAPIEVVGICDVDKIQLRDAEQLIRTRLRHTRPIPTYNDHLQLLKDQQPQITIIGTPDHWHALQTIDALRYGSNVYVQKPVSVDVREGEAMLDAARKYNRIVQVGTQRRSTPHLIEAKKNIVEAGLLGNIHHVELFCYYHMRNNSTPPLQPVPEHFDYDRWTGPAPLRAFDGMPHGGWWRAFMEYGNGIMGDMCIHMLDAVRWMLGLGWPQRISSSGGILNSPSAKSNIADTQTAIFQFNGLNCVWQHRTWGEPVDPQYPWGYKIYGDKGTLSCSPYQYDFTPSGKNEKVHRDALYEKEKYPEDVSEKGIEIHAAPATRAHMLNFLESIDSKKHPVADIEEGYISTACCILANIAMKVGRVLEYDPVKRLVVNDPEATQLLKRNYRGPWIHPSDDVN